MNSDVMPPLSRLHVDGADYADGYCAELIWVRPRCADAVHAELCHGEGRGGICTKGPSRLLG